MGNLSQGELYNQMQKQLQFTTVMYMKSLSMVQLVLIALTAELNATDIIIFLLVVIGIRNVYIQEPSSLMRIVN